ncbi:ribosome small subunit-dependent GTPase A [Owenweeksia hongkongensis]|uniref:ribosome small subunit-dependent GTPase A n=1 Tax=Owenweeksia hongkongensis TaxID=253245 RepID=UPI003A954636
MQGTVTKSTGSWYQVKTDAGEVIQCRIVGKLRLRGIKSTNPVAVGDVVEFKMEEGEETAVISDILPRKNYIIRKSVNLAKQTQIIAANLDQAVLIVTLDFPKTYPRFIDRFLVTAEAYSIPAVVVFNKVDLYSDADLDELEFYTLAYEDAGYTVLHSSVPGELGLEELKELLQNKTSLLSGHSGVGKSTLVNTVEPGLDLKTKAISSSHHQGQHTTTFAEMFELSFGGNIIDTPGIRGFGLVDMEKEEIGDYFPEIFRIKGQCKFNNCIHIEEPGCAIKAALEEGELAYTRYDSYVNFVNGTDEDENYRKDIYAN